MNHQTYSAALITGASSGIGMAFARLLPATTDMLLHGRDHGRLSALAAELARPGRRVEIVIADLTIPQQRQTVVAAADAMGIDLLINNAGFGRLGPALDNTVTDEGDMVLLNSLAPVVLTRALLPRMIARLPAGRRAGVIQIASVAGFLPVPFFATYAASKAFLLSYSQALAAELADAPADILALCPGPTATAFFDRAGMAGAPARAHSAEAVARSGLAALGRRPVAVVGLVNRMVALASQILPRGLMVRLAAATQRRRRAAGQG